MKIKDLLFGIDYEVIKGSIDLEIKDLAYNSKKVKEDSLFICIKGFKLDGHDYINDAIKNGACAILVEKELNEYPKNISVIKVKNTRKTLPKISNIFFGEPSKNFKLVGITGTNGKTSVSIFISTILQHVNHKVGVIGTIDNRINNNILNIERTTITTPESYDLQVIFKKMEEEKVNEVIMEASSMALELHRVDDCDFDIGVFTNLTQDHLDDHKTMENYKNAKLKLFDKCRYAVVNGDDSVSDEIRGISKENILRYGVNDNNDLYAKNIKITSDGVSFDINLKREKRGVYLKVPGLFSVYNALAAVGVCYYLGLTIDEIVEGMTKIEGVRGRFETINSPKGYSVIVDYAHTADALENVINTAKEFANGSVYTVFGCGGDRDKTKRPKMGKTAGLCSDFCVITSDNPRTEEPEKILEDVEVGIKETDCDYECIVDRKSAIYYAMDKAKKGDVIIIAGKGHETYQILKNKVIHFDDVEVVKEYIEK